MTDTTTQSRVYSNFERTYSEFLDSTDLTRYDKATRLASQVDLLSKTQEGIKFLLSRAEEMEEHGFFDTTPWEAPDRLVPSLVTGTLRAGHPNSTYEVMSELRLLARLKSKKPYPNFSLKEIEGLLEEVMVHNMEFAFDELTEESRNVMSTKEVTKVMNLFALLLDHMSFDGIKDKLAEEIRLVCAQRPVVTRKVRRLIELVNNKVDFSSQSEVDRELQFFTDAIYRPSPLSRQTRDLDEYRGLLEDATSKEVFNEAHSMGYFMRETGLVSAHHGTLLSYLVDDHPDMVPEALALEPTGKAEWHEHARLVKRIIRETLTNGTSQCVYGLSHVLERALFSREAVRSSFNNLRMITLNEHIEKRILKSVSRPVEGVTAKHYLMGATLRVLGQPLGIGQGNNATCQSARGISMWSQHSPAKLLDMIITVCTRNNLAMRFENDVLESIKLDKGLVDNLDYNLDAVSAVLVPHLDKIYNEMMRRASGRGEDPHKWVNPALYGHWIQVGFAGCYDYLSNSIHDFKGFIKLFYAAFHPGYNGGRKMIYPNPVGIFITSSRGEMVGFHAVSLLRIAKHKDSGEVRAYFLNPNNEGRQDWGQGIEPTVYGNGEVHGESSLPIEHFAARIYAFHYNALEVTPHLSTVPDDVAERVEKLARESWGKKYVWNEFSKKW